jgi:hypothetical protein
VVQLVLVVRRRLFGWRSAMITIALDAAIKAAVAIEFMRDLFEAEVVDADTIMFGSLMPDDVLRVHAQARAAVRKLLRSSAQ